MKKLNSGVCALCACMIAMLMLVGCPQANGGSNRGGGGNTGGTSTTAPTIARTAHMKVEKDEQGLKITPINVNTNDWARIYIIDDTEELPGIELWDNEEEYIYNFTENGETYKVKIEGKGTDGHDFCEEALCQAGGGRKFSDCVDLTDFFNSTVTGSYTDATHFQAKLASTDIHNPSDIIKDSDFIDDCWFDFILIIGEDSWHEWNDSSIGIHDVSTTSGELGDVLTTLQAITLDEEIDDWDEWPEYMYSFAFRPNYTVRGNDQTYIGKEIRSPTKFYTEGLSTSASHFMAEPDPDGKGIKVTITYDLSNSPRNNPPEYQGFGISVPGCPVRIESNTRTDGDENHFNKSGDRNDDGQQYYIFPFVDDDEEYVVRLETDVDDVSENGGHIVEYVKCTANGGYGYDFFNFDKLYNANIRGNFNNTYGFSTQLNAGINNLSDIVSDVTKVTDFALISEVNLGTLGHGYWDDEIDDEHWVGHGARYLEKDSSDSEFFNKTWILNRDNGNTMPTAAVWNNYGSMYTFKFIFRFWIKDINDQSGPHPGQRLQAREAPLYEAYFQTVDFWSKPFHK